MYNLLETRISLNKSCDQWLMLISHANTYTIIRLGKRISTSLLNAH